MHCSFRVKKGLPKYQPLQNEYNLYSRKKYEGSVQDMVVKEGLGAITYYGLASGFLTGKYRSAADFSKSQRGQGMKQYLNTRGNRILAALDYVAAHTGADLAEIALAWIIAQPGIVAPIASATSVGQLTSLARGARHALSSDALKILADVGK